MYKNNAQIYGIKLVKRTFIKILFSTLFVIFIIIKPSAAEAKTPPHCLNSTNIEALKKIAGTYILSGLIEDVKKHQVFFGHLIRRAPVAQITISKEGKVDFANGGWHEGWSWDQHDQYKECISVIDNDTLLFHVTEFNSCKEEHCKSGKDTTYEYSRILTTSPGHLFFNLIFQGCFEDSKNKKWCFEDGIHNKTLQSFVPGKYSKLYLDGKITVNGVQKFAEFELDRVELPKADVILSIEGENLLWIFYKIKNGWRICKSEPVTVENYKTEPCQEIVRN